MSTVTNLVTLGERNAASNRDALVVEARDGCAAFGVDLDFDRLDWDVTKHCPKAAGKAGQKTVLYFATHENGTKKNADERTPLPEPFGSVIKSLVRQQKDGNPSIGADQLNRMINASRYLAPLLADRGYDPCRLVPKDLEDARRAIIDRGGKPATHYRLGQQLEKIVAELNRRHILVFAFTWRNPFRRVANTVRIGKEADKNRGKIVEEEILDELARLSHIVTSDSDRMRMAGVKLFHCAPWRVGEVNTIPDDPWVERQKIGPDGPVFDTEGRPVIRCGIRYWPEKSKDGDIKWIPDAMVEVARSAIDTLIEVSAPARKLARWYEEHIGRAWLPGADEGPNQVYTMAEVADMFGLNRYTAARQWLRTRGVPIDDSARTGFVRRGDLELALLTEWQALEYLTRDRRGLKRSQHLFLTLANLHNYRGTNPCMLGMTTDQHFSDFLSTRGDRPEEREEKRQGQVLSVFERYGSTMADGSPMRCKSHGFRHWLNDIAQRGGMGQHLVARWSGRKEIAQNGEYDHMSGVELAEQGRNLMADGKVMGILADVHNRLSPVERSAFRDNVMETAHVTDLGMCDHNFFSSPCPEFSGDGCGPCENLNVVKGEPKSRQRALQNRDDTAWLLERALEEMHDETEGASNFVEAHTLTLSALERIIAIHDDPAIPEGTWVRVNAESPAQFEGPPLKRQA
ncbi:hypothetical protein [Sphingomonas sp.]|uniref:hypothetical protein n=1 Tax=Sphingomonas sp. TaxID=28214 RepID=UPI0017DFB24F|nr:hypothetical protein [Sphingomonas sp.]MBA4761925.1 hypothetical protein [Sphingomonas sp.]